MTTTNGEKGTIFDIKKYAIHDGPGIRTTVFLKGCPLDCWWCHNPESRAVEIETLTVARGGNGKGRRQETVGRVATVAEVLAEIEKDTIFYDQSGGGATLSGGEPMMQPAFTAALLRACREHGITTILDTSGYGPAEDFGKIDGLVDLYLYDLKLMDDQTHVRYTGVSNSTILDNLIMLSDAGKEIIIRIPLVPGITDTRGNIASIIEFLAPLEGIRRISLLPYNRMAEDKCRRFSLANRLGHVEPQTPDTLDKLRAHFESCGYEVSIGG
jgi:pyruvate formate lyase activating enzyme